MDLDPHDARAVVLRMKRAHGHLASVIRMVEEGTELEAVLTQLSAVNKALARTGFAIVAAGLQDCVARGPDGEADLSRVEKLFLSLA